MFFLSVGREEEEKDYLSWIPSHPLSLHFPLLPFLSPPLRMIHLRSILPNVFGVEEEKRIVRSRREIRPLDPSDRPSDHNNVERVESSLENSFPRRYLSFSLLPCSSRRCPWRGKDLAKPPVCSLPPAAFPCDRPRLMKGFGRLPHLLLLFHSKRGKKKRGLP